MKQIGRILLARNCRNDESLQNISVGNLSPDLRHGHRAIGNREVSEMNKHMTKTKSERRLDALEAAIKALATRIDKLPTTWETGAHHREVPAVIIKYFR